MSDECDMADADTLVFAGGALKAIDPGRPGLVGGYLVLFGSPDQADASKYRDYFTPETDFGLDLSVKSRVLYHHGLDEVLSTRALAIGELKMDDAGVWIEAQLQLRDEYEKKLYAAVKDGKMGLSSGTASHLVRRQKQPNGAHKVLSWPLGLDASITPTPAEPRTQAQAIKSLAALRAEAALGCTPAEAASAREALAADAMKAADRALYDALLRLDARLAGAAIR